MIIIVSSCHQCDACVNNCTGTDEIVLNEYTHVSLHDFSGEYHSDTGTIVNIAPINSACVII